MVRLLEDALLRGRQLHLAFFFSYLEQFLDDVILKLASFQHLLRYRDGIDSLSNSKVWPVDLFLDSVNPLVFIIHSAQSLVFTHGPSLGCLYLPFRIPVRGLSYESLHILPPGQ